TVAPEILDRLLLQGRWKPARGRARTRAHREEQPAGRLPARGRRRRQAGLPDAPRQGRAPSERARGPAGDWLPPLPRAQTSIPGRAPASGRGRRQTLALLRRTP